MLTGRDGPHGGGRRRWLRATVGAALTWALAPRAALAQASAARMQVPFTRLAVPEPPYEERYEALVATTPPLARSTPGRVVMALATRADGEAKTERLTRVLDPQRTQLHLAFVQGLADRLADADGAPRVLRVPVDAADTERRLLDQVRELAPQADGILLANVTGRFVALHGLADYVPGVIVGIKALHPRSGRVWLEAYFTAGFSGVDPRVWHLESVPMDERFADFDALLLRADAARDALVRGAEALGEEVARRLGAAA